MLQKVIRMRTLFTRNYCSLLKQYGLNDDLFDRFLTKSSSIENDPDLRRSVIDGANQLKMIESNLRNLDELAKSEDGEMRDMARKETDDAKSTKREVQRRILESLYRPSKLDNRTAVVELRSGAGGQEAMLFCTGNGLSKYSESTDLKSFSSHQTIFWNLDGPTAELIQMYTNFCSFANFAFVVDDVQQSDVGGIRFASARAIGAGAYGRFKFEGGVHRVQRVPATERAGRVHTSTVAIAVLPQGRLWGGLAYQ